MENLTLFPLYQTTCFFIPLVAPCPPLLAFVEKKKNIKINQLFFRSKQDGWNYESLYYQQADGLSGKLKNSYYADYFGWEYLFRDSCYACPKAGSSREGDITLEDFWGIEKYVSEETFPNLKVGTSMVLLNTKQGQSLFHSTKSRIWYYSLDVKIACKENHQLEHPMKINPNRRKLIFNCYKIFGANGVEGFYQVERKLMRITTRLRKK